MFAITGADGFDYFFEFIMPQDHLVTLRKEVQSPQTASIMREAMATDVPHNPSFGILSPGQGKSRMRFTECVGGVLYLSADSITVQFRAARLSFQKFQLFS